MLDVLFYDTCGGAIEPPGDEVMGGADVSTAIVAMALAKAGLCVEVASVGLTHPREEAGVSWTCSPNGFPSRALVLNRWTQALPWMRADRVVVAAHDFGDIRYAHHAGRKFICVSHFQAANFRWLGETTVIRPPLGEHVWSCSAESDPRRWIYASDVDKGLDETLSAWEGAAQGATLAVTCRAHGKRDVRGVEWLGPLSPRAMVEAMARCAGMFYRNGPSAECFPVVVAIARALGLEMDVSCVGHEKCGVQEALTVDLETLRPEVVAKRWIEELGL